ncbi:MULTISPECIES: hypothetical protein [unclassified Micromonospora]|uniref:hypothetical protein n=1 Tax=unclassified Micromonospora TaxID=2617518 RepID=UPI00104A255B|nr:MULTISPECIES: hypothetical protein [unclassified Micromonospora]TDB79124.1 hypothetical protein E1182_13835 [Micromonospora sp. KC721]TDC42430.1 hypothetical protein E1166_07625 [Micromonospora sp. KC213]
MPNSTLPNARSGRSFARLLDAATFVWGVAGATALVSKGAHDAGGQVGWPRWWELTYVTAVVVAGMALAVAGWAKWRARHAGAVLADERTAATHLRATAAALVGALAVQLPFFFRIEVPSVAQAQFTVAGALAAYGAARLWFNRDA